MSLNGQWIGRYTGTNNGLAVIDVDELPNYYNGTVCAWDDNPLYASSLIRFSTVDKNTAHDIRGVPLLPINSQSGEPLSAPEIQTMAERGVIHPATVDITLDLTNAVLTVQWFTPINTQGVAQFSKSSIRSGIPSALIPLRIKKWSQFKQHVNELNKGEYIFRGQKNNHWRLRSSFFRAGRANLERYLNFDIPDLEKIFSALTNHSFDTRNPKHYAALIHLAQHHGYPTPMLDWTWSPYVAAFFSFRDLEQHAPRKRGAKVRIFKFAAARWNALRQYNIIFPSHPNITILNPLAFNNPRAIPQQSISLLSNVDDIESYIDSIHGSQGAHFLEAIDLSAGDRDEVMRELALMGVTAGSLFPGLDGACEALRARNF